MPQVTVSVAQRYSVIIETNQQAGACVYTLVNLFAHKLNAILFCRLRSWRNIARYVRIHQPWTRNLPKCHNALLLCSQHIHAFFHTSLT